MKVIALRGTEGTGKSNTLKQLIQKVANQNVCVYACETLRPFAKEDKEKNMPDAACRAQNAPTFAGDLYAAFQVKGVYLGVTTQGDSYELLQNAYDQTCKALRDAASIEKPDIFLCAIRTYGATNSFVDGICDEKPAFIYNKASIDTMETLDDSDFIKGRQECLNRIQAKILFSHLKILLREDVKSSK